MHIVVQLPCPNGHEIEKLRRQRANEIFSNILRAHIDNAEDVDDGWPETFCIYIESFRWAPPAKLVNEIQLYSPMLYVFYPCVLAEKRRRRRRPNYLPFGRDRSS